MIIVAIMGLIFNLIQMKILHSGDGHYHLGGGNHEHEHGHDHEHHDHDHKHHDHEMNPEKDALLEQLLPKEHKEHKHSHEHNHDHDHDHGHDNDQGHGHNINVTSAYLHVLGDMLMSVGVIIAAFIIYFFPAWNIADPICTYLFSVIICFTTVPVFKDCILVLLEGTPDQIDMEQLETDMLNLPGVEDLHDFHVWSISVGKFALSAHITSETPLKTLCLATDLCRRKYKLFHTTIQMEGTTESKHFFKCENDLHD